MTPIAHKWAVGSDHAGSQLRRAVADHLLQLGCEVHDVGPSSSEPVDYADYAEQACRLVQAGTCEMAVLACGTGLGVAMAAGRLEGIRAALCCTEYMARMARSHNDANVLCLGERVLGMGVAHGIVETFLQTAFQGGRHVARLAKLSALAPALPRAGTP